MSERPSAAARLDQALDGLLAGAPAAVAAAGAALDAALAPLVMLGADLKAALPVPVVASRFEARLEARLSDPAAGRDALAWILRHPTRLLVTGAVGSAAVGMGITAFAAWRHGHRPGRATHRLLQR